MRALYNILFIISFVLSSPYYFMRMRRRGNWRNGFSERFGQYDAKLKQSITNRHVLWMHAVSVGEVNVCAQLIRALEPRVPNVKIIVSTTTTTGMGELQKKLPSRIGRIYYPVDRRKYVARAQGTIHPEAIVLVEAEIWPNFIWRARDTKTPLFLVNARLSDRSYLRYKRFGFIFRPLFASFTGVGAQNESDATRLRDLGCRPEAVHVIGNLKFDAVNLEGGGTLDVPGLLERLGVGSDAFIWVAGSTHDGEETLLAEKFLKLRARFPRLFLVLVPRHFERARKAGSELRKLGLKLFYRTDIKADTKLASGAVDCLMVNTTGELMKFYRCATLVFVGKSLGAAGGQNPIEPAALGKAMVFGPNMQNFAEIARTFVADNGAVQVRDAVELEKAVGDLLADEPRRVALGRNALKVVRENQGAVARTADLIVKHLEGGELYVVPRR